MNEKEYQKIIEISKEIEEYVNKIIKILDEKWRGILCSPRDLCNCFHLEEKYARSEIDSFGIVFESRDGGWNSYEEGYITGYRPAQIAQKYLIKEYNFAKNYRLDKVLSTIAAVKKCSDPKLLTLNNLAVLASQEKYHRFYSQSYTITSKQVEGYLQILLRKERLKTTPKDIFYLYKYVDTNNKIVYIGKTIDLVSRIAAHKGDKLKGFIGKIYYIQCSNKTNMDFLEYVLINKYHPELNVQYNDINIKTEWINEPEWHEYIK